MFSEIFLTGSYGGSGGACVAGGSKTWAEPFLFTNNTNEQLVFDHLDAYGMAFYKGVPVFMMDLPFEGSAFSFGIIVLDDAYRCATNESFSKTLRHEFGHAVHFRQIGGAAYTATVAIPSLIGAGASYISPYIDSIYFSLPWERIADHLGGVERTYAPGANTIGSLYWIGTLLCAEILKGH